MFYHQRINSFRGPDPLEAIIRSIQTFITKVDQNLYIKKISDPAL